MRIVLGNYQFDNVGGSETYALTLAEQLLKLGHDITIYVKVPGKMAEVAREREIKVVTNLELAMPDVVLSQDGVVAYEMSAKWPEVSHAFICHSPLFELQTPPAVPGMVGAVVVMSERFENRLRALATKHRIVRLRQPIDVDRLAPIGSARKQPRKVLLLGNYLQGQSKRFLTEAWGGAGLEFMQVGTPAGTNSVDIVQTIAEADIVVGKARAILDAMSCGRPAYLYDVFGTDGWVTPQVYDAMEADAFAGLALSRPFDPTQLVADLSAYDPLMGVTNRKLVMMNHHARIHAQQIIDLCSDLAKPTASQTTPKLELSRLVASNWRSESKLLTARIAFGAVAERAKRAEDEVSRLRDRNENYRHTIKQLTSELKNPTAGGERNEVRRQLAARVEEDLKVDQGGLSDGIVDEPNARIRLSQVNRSRRHGESKASDPQAVSKANGMNELKKSDRAPYLMCADDVEIADDVSIGAYVVLYPGTRLGRGARIEHGAIIGRPSQSNPGSVAQPTIQQPTDIGARTIVGAYAIVCSGAITGADAYVGDHALIREGARLGEKASVGFSSTVGSKCVIGEGTRIQGFCGFPAGTIIEGNCAIGPYVVALATTFSSKGRIPTGPVVVRKGARIGSAAQLMPGVEIGAGATVGAASVVTRSVQPGATVRGTPASATGVTRDS